MHLLGVQPDIERTNKCLNKCFNKSIHQSISQSINQSFNMNEDAVRHLSQRLHASLQTLPALVKELDWCPNIDCKTPGHCEHNNWLCALCASFCVLASPIASLLSHSQLGTPGSFTMPMEARQLPSAQQASDPAMPFGLLAARVPQSLQKVPSRLLSGS